VGDAPQKEGAQQCRWRAEQSGRRRGRRCRCRGLSRLRGKRLGDLHAAGAHARIGVREAPQEEESAVSVVELDDSVELVHVEVQEPAARLGVVILEDDEWQRPGLVVLPKCDDKYGEL